MRKKLVKIAVGLSGGVDSSVAALLLKRAGYDVTAVFLTCWSRGVGCSSEQDRKDAVAVAAQIGIPIRIWNFEREYQKRVIDRFYQEYKRGRTPNSDIWCNEEIKFGLFLERALKELKVDYIATGHYARVVSGLPGAKPSGTLSRKTPEDTPSTSFTSASARRFRGKVPFGFSADNQQYHLLNGLDPTKDQSYFLYRLNQFQLSKTLFPIGQFTKQQVRKIAKQNNLLTAKKPDSQGICFVGKVDLREFLQKRIKLHPGEVVTSDGRVIGGHEGVEFYTIGQRHGFQITKYQGAPLYVIEKDIKNNRLIVGRDEESEVGEFEVEDVHWVDDDPCAKPSGTLSRKTPSAWFDNTRWDSHAAARRSPRSEQGLLSIESRGAAARRFRGKVPFGFSASVSSEPIFVRIRHLGEFIPCEIHPSGSNLIIHLIKPTRGVAPGQHAVLYDPTSAFEVLGGGVIKK